MASYRYPASGGASPYWGAPVANQAALPAAGSAVGEIRLVLDTDDLYEWNGVSWERITQNSADVTGPGSSTDNAIARFDGTTGKIIQNSVVTIGDTGVMAGASIDADTNTITNIENADIKAGAGIAVNKLAALTASRAVATDGSGFLTVATTTAAELEFVNGVTSAIQTQLNAKVNKAGDTMTGYLVLHADPDAALKAATKQYVDSVAAGLDVKPSVKCATTANITLSGEQTLDGVLTSASRVLVKNQSTQAENGIYVSDAGAWTRATDMDAWTEVPGAFCFVEQGTLYADTGWVCSADAGGTIGVTAITWSQFAGAGTYTAGTGLTLTGTQFSITALTANRAVVTDGSGNRTASTTTATEIGYVNGVTSAIQTQLNAIRAGKSNVSVSSDVTLTDQAIHLVSTAAARSLTLPAPAASMYIVLKDVTGSCQTNNITINPNGAQTIDGSATYVVDWNYAAVIIVSDGTNYYCI